MELSSKEHLKPFAHAPQNRCFGCGPANPTGLHLEFLIAPDGAVVSFPAVGENFEGHPGYLHGGIIATLLDEAMSRAVRAWASPQ
jgi:acyl-coenzyme A thioesterase PaaI-like protein